MLVVTRHLPRRSWLISFSLAGLMFLMPLTAAANGAGPDTAVQVDSLWNQPQGTRPDSALYVIQAWWDGLTRASTGDRKQRGLQELSQANSDLLNAYSLLQEQRTNPGPHPVAVVDPILSGAYGLLTGVNVKAPIGSLLGWVNESLVHLEGRGTTETIVGSLLRDYQVQRAAASRDLAPAAADTVWTANSSRETAMLQKIGALATPSLGMPLLLAATTPAVTVAPAGGGSQGGKANGKGNALGQSGDPHGKSGDPHGKSNDPHGTAVGHQPEKH